MILILAFYISLRIFRSPFGLMLRAVKSNQNRLNYTGINTRPYTLAAFVISGMYAGLAGGLMAVMLPGVVSSAGPPAASSEGFCELPDGQVVGFNLDTASGDGLGDVVGTYRRFAAMCRGEGTGSLTWNGEVIATWP